MSDFKLHVVHVNVNVISTLLLAKDKTLTLQNTQMIIEEENHLKMFN